MNRRLVVGIAIVGLLLIGIALAFSAPTAESDEIEQEVVLGQTDEVDRTIFRITVFEDGDARWTIENRREIPLSAEEEIEEFEAFAEQFVEEDTETFQNFRHRAHQLTQEGSEVTDREMDASNFERDARYFNQEGIIEMSFRWEGFAEDEGDRIVVSDIFDGGFVILEDQKLRFEHGEELRFERMPEDHPPDRTELDEEDSPGEWMEWDGPQEFSAGSPEIVFVPADTPTEETQTDEPETDEAADDEQHDQEEEDSGMMVPVLFTLLLLVSVGGGALWYKMSRQEGGITGTEPADSPVEGGGSRTGTGPAIQQEQLLSDEDRVIKLLEENGGRMRQVSIVEETEWSKSKVSMLLSAMEEEGEISKLRVGRENIISLAGQEPAAAGSPFEDEEDR